MPTKKLVKAKEYKVKDNDTLESIAKANSLTVKQLMRFNWGTESIGKHNTLLRDKLGSRKLDKDKNYIIAKEDDPGIIYIPEVPASPKTFATNSKHTLTVKPPVKKTFKTARCMVIFRPDAGWKGEYGFDWLRNGDWTKADNYLDKSLLDGGYKIMSKAGMSADDAMKSYKKLFDTLKSKLSAKPDYYVGVLNIFPKGLGGTPAPTSTFKLKVSVEIEHEAADALKLQIPTYKDKDDKEQPYFKLVAGSLDLPTGVGKHDATIELSCEKEFKSQLEIKAMAVTREEDGSYQEYEAGKMIAMPNAESNRKKMKFACVKVSTDVKRTGVATTGVFKPGSITNLRNALFQALVIPEIENAPTLDLSRNGDFRKPKPDGKEGRFYTNAQPTEVGLNQDDPEFFAKVKSLFLKTTGNEKYKDYFLVFSFGERPYDKALGQVQNIGVKNLIVFPGDTDDCTINHEVMHGLGLSHSFKDDPKEVKSIAKFTFKKGLTDNVMDYTYDGSALRLWQWQWKMVN